MFFRSTASDADAFASNSDINGHDSLTESLALSNQDHDVCMKREDEPAQISKFATLKRKLFPSQNLRQPRRVPPLVVSPINASIKDTCTSEVLLKSIHCKQYQNGEGLSILNNRDIQPECIRQNDVPEENFYSAESDNNSWITSNGRTLNVHDDDRDLENAVEAMDLDNMIGDNTLEEMSKAFDDLRMWKETHEKATRESFGKIRTQLELLLDKSFSIDSAIHEICQEEQIELKIQQQQRNRETQILGIKTESKAYQLECNLRGTSLDDSTANRVKQALEISDEPESLVLSRLCDELFELEVQQRKETLLREVYGNDNVLDMNIVDVQAFTGELDAILAQFEDLTFS